MTDRVGFQVEGLSKVVRDLKAMGVEVNDLKDAFSKIAAEGADIAERHTPKRSGRLAASIRGNRAQSKAVVTAGRSAVPYAGVANYGWPSHNIPAAEFMQAADREMQPIALRRLEDEITALIRKKGLT
jgi:phage gpG-like protein